MHNQTTKKQNTNMKQHEHNNHHRNIIKHRFSKRKQEQT